jgi:hypothetical protein
MPERLVYGGKLIAVATAAAGQIRLHVAPACPGLVIR